MAKNNIAEQTFVPTLNEYECKSGFICLRLCNKFACINDSIVVEYINMWKMWKSRRLVKGSIYPGYYLPSNSASQFNPY